MTNRCTLRSLLRATFILLAAGAVSFLMASGPAIGIAVADGGFRVDHSQVWGNATLFDGSVIETGQALSRLRFADGSRLSLASDSRAIVHRGRLVLEAGMGQLESAPGFEVESRSLRISAAEPGTVARIRLGRTPKVTVAALRGAVRVRNAAGVLVASVKEGASLDFEPQQQMATEGNAASSGTSGAGSASSAGSASGAAGSSSAASGAAGAGGASGASGAAGAAGAGAASGGAGAAGAAAGAAAATSAGIGAGTVAVIGGVAVGATVGGLAATGELPGQGDSTPSVSR